MRIRRRKILAAAILVCLTGIASSSAQSVEPPPTAASTDVSPIALAPPLLTISLDQMQELKEWSRDFLNWQKAVDRWLNLRKQGSWSTFLERHKKPEPPAWLQGACALLADDPQFAAACEMRARWSDDPFTVRSRKAASTAVAQKEAPENSVWWRHVHLDGLWSTTQSNMSVFGLFGMHLTVPVEGRMQVFVTPGVLMMSVPTLFGTRELKAATDWGVSYRLFEAGRNTVHFNLVHAWVIASGRQLASPQMTLAGFSLSFNPRRP